jgi:hypothetical protein
MYSFQHFEPIQYVNNLSKSLITFQINDPKVTINLDDFPSLSELMVQQLLIQFSQLVTNCYWNENFDVALMDILKDNWDSSFKYVVSLLNIFCNTNITKKESRNQIQYLQFFLKNNTNVHYP